MSDRPPAPSSLLKLLQQPRLARLSSSYASNRPAIQKVLTASLLVWVLGITCKGVLFPGKKKGDVVVGRQPKGGRRSRAGKGPRVEVCPPRALSSLVQPSTDTRLLIADHEPCTVPSRSTPSSTPVLPSCSGSSSPPGDPRKLACSSSTRPSSSLEPSLAST